jgi:hypothetical protein
MPTTLRNTDILFNDGTTQATAATAGGLVTTANVLNATAGATGNAVGSYAVCLDFSGSFSINSTRAGSSVGGGLSGTWRAMQTSTVFGGVNFGVFLRIS